MIVIDGRNYELRYDIKTVETIENVVRKSIVDIIREVPTISVEKIIIGYALYTEDGNKVSSQQGVKLAEQLIQENGLLMGFEKAVEKISEDCAFLFLDN